MQRLAALREQLLKVYKEKGIEEIKKLSRETQRETDRSTVWSITKPVYGIPGSGLAFQNFVLAAMKRIGFTASIVVPGIFYKRSFATNDRLVGADNWVIVAISTDDFRYFGTDAAV